MTLSIHIAFDALSGVDGSARFSFGHTTAIASVSGPITSRLAAEHPVHATIDIHVRPPSSVPRTTEKHTAIALKGIIERACILAQHPRSSIQVVVQALSPPPSSARHDSDVDLDLDADVRLAAEINAVTLALLNTGSVPLRGAVCAVAVAITDPQTQLQPQLVSDLSRDTTNTRTGHSGCFAFLFGYNIRTHTFVETDVPPSEMIWTNYRARPGNAFSLEALAQAEKVASRGAAAVWTKMKQSLSTSSSAGDGPS